MLEFKTAAELRTHYRELRKRFYCQPPAPEPEPSLQEPEAIEPEPAPPPPPPKPLPKHKLKRLARIVCEHYGVPFDALSSPMRCATLIRPRHVFFYLCHEVARQSFPTIGRFIGRDHTSVLHGYRKIKAKMEIDDVLAADIAQMSARFSIEDDGNEHSGI